MSDTGRWSDLATRLASALVMVAIGGGAVWIGGWAFHLLLVLVCGMMTWELWRMLAPGDDRRAVLLGGLVALAVLVGPLVPVQFLIPVLGVPVVVGAYALSNNRLIYATYAMLILLAGYAMWLLRSEYGLGWMLWLIVVVVASDVAGYFAGKALGGPKFWPRISPKKTWSGTLAGWIAAALVGVGFVSVLGGGAGLVILSVVMAMAAQAGDIAESAMKRRAGIKDSSNLIPGHGGVLDRFDGMLGAAVLTLLAGAQIAANGGAG